MGTQGGSLVSSRGAGPRTCEPTSPVAERRSSSMALLCTRRTSSCSKAFRSCSSLEAVRTLSTALGRIVPEASEAGEAGEAGVRGLPSASACPAGVETCRQIEVLSRRLWLGAAATLDATPRSRRKLPCR